MKKIYWRPHGFSLTTLILICAFSLAGFASVEKFQRRIKQPYYGEKVRAANLALEAMETVKEERLKRKIEIDEENDPIQSGLIGPAISPVTSDAGDLSAKQTSINPNFAAVIVELLKGVHAKEGDTVAVSFTGSFPALNISVCAALQTLKLVPIIISSTASSQWGANLPGFLWIDMEQFLYENHVFSFRSAAASMGGKGDQGREMTQEGRESIMKAIEKNGLPLLQARILLENIDRRMRIYRRGQSPKVFINVGGGVISVGRRARRRMLRSGIILSRPGTPRNAESVMDRFLGENVPVIHIENVKAMARHYGLPLVPQKMPAVGEGNIFFRTEYNSLLAGIILIATISILYIFARSDIGFRIFQTTSRREEMEPPEPMI